MRRFSNFITIFTILFSVFCLSQVGINTSSPLAGTSLQIDGDDTGVLINRVALMGTDDVTTIPLLSVAHKGLMVFNTTDFVVAGNASKNTYEGFYYWTGTEWVATKKSGYKRTGWVALNDGDYAITVNAQSNADLSSITNFTDLDLNFSNDPTPGGDSTISAYAPSGYTAADFFDDSTHRLQALELGDSVHVRFQCDAISGSNNGYLLIALDIGNASTGPIIIYQKSIRLVRGNGRVNRISESILLFQLSTFVANGAKFKVGYNSGGAGATDGATGNVDISNVSLVISRD